MAANAWRGASSFVHQSAELLIESDRQTPISPGLCGDGAGAAPSVLSLSYRHSVKE